MVASGVAYLLFTIVWHSTEDALTQQRLHHTLVFARVQAYILGPVIA
eukprot:gene54766-23661_t